MLYLSNCLIRCVCKKSLLSFSYFSMVIKKNMQNQNKFVGNSLSLAPPPPPLCHCICVAIFIILESQSEKLWDQNYKLRPQNYKLRSQNYKLRSQNYKLRSQNYKLRPQNYKLRVQNLQVWQLKLISYNFLKRCFECTVNGSLQMVVTRLVSDQIALRFSLYSTYSKRIKNLSEP